MIPEAHAQGTASGTSFGGPQLGLAARAFGGMFHMQSSQASHDSAIAALNAQWERRRDEWSFQREQASLDLKKIDVELLAARIQESVASLRVENHDKTTANTEAVLDVYRKRFFTADQYSAAAEDLYPDYFALFQLAYQYVRQAEACCRFQFGLTDLNVIQFRYWSDAIQHTNQPIFVVLPPPRRAAGCRASDLCAEPAALARSSRLVAGPRPARG
jgi:hypothetical protein